MIKTIGKIVNCEFTFILFLPLIKLEPMVFCRNMRCTLLEIHRDSERENGFKNSRGKNVEKIGNSYLLITILSLLVLL